MLSKFTLAAAILPLVYGLSISAPENPTSAGPITINWTAEPSDDSFSIYLYNTVFNDNFGIANNVDPAAQTLDLTLPAVPVRDGYTLRAVNVGNITDVYATSPTFSVGPNASSSVSGSSTASSGASTATSPGTTTTTSPASTRASSTGSGTSSAAANTNTATTFNSPAAATLPLGMTSGGVVAFAVSVLAGAALISF